MIEPENKEAIDVNLHDLVKVIVEIEDKKRDRRKVTVDMVWYKQNKNNQL